MKPEPACCRPGDGGGECMDGKDRRKDWVARAPRTAGLERIEAYFGGRGYEMHRHDTYAIGRTLSGVQSFHYRRGLRHSLPGGTLVLHPDEAHDGQAGTDAGFRYRMLYVEPALVQRMLGGQPLPFVPGGLSDDPRLRAAAEPLLRTMSQPLDPLEEADALYDLAQALATVAGQRGGRRAFDYGAAERARQRIHDGLAGRLTLADLEAASGRDRWSLSRDFRALYGVSPYRYATLRRLDACRRLMLAGQGLAEAALAAGFTDQSHMSRHFSAAYGMPPGRWLAMLRAGA